MQAVTPVTLFTLLTTAFIVVFHRPQDVRDLGRSYIWLNSVIYVFASAVTMLLFPYLVLFYQAPVRADYGSGASVFAFHWLRAALGFSRRGRWGILHRIGSGDYVDRTPCPAVWA